MIQQSSLKKKMKRLKLKHLIKSMVYHLQSWFTIDI